MSAIIRAAAAEDVPEIVALLAHMNPKLAPERWRRLFLNPWRATQPDLGRVAVADGRVVGFVGMVYAERWIAGRTERVVNICAWFLDKGQRGRGLGAALMRAATTDDGASYTILTSSAKTRAILDAVGYRVLDAERRLWRRRAAPPPDLAVIDDPAAVRDAADPQGRRLLDDHAGLPVRPVLVRRGDGQSLLLFSRKLKGADVLYWDLLHVGDRTFLTAQAQGIADALLPHGADAVLAADLRFLEPPGRAGERERFAVPRFYKSARLAPEHIDNLYSEVQLLDLKLD